MSRTNNPNAITRLSLLESDLKGLQIALEDYLVAKSKVHSYVAAMADASTNDAAAAIREASWSRMFHHAKVFVVGMRRFARLLEASKTHNRDYPRDVASAITLSWKKKRGFFDQYREARDAIEHIDGEVNGYNRRFVNLWGDSLEVVAGKRAPVNLTALRTVENSWAEIVDSIMCPREVRVRSALTRRLVSVLRARVESLSSEDKSPNKPLQATRSPRA